MNGLEARVLRLERQLAAYRIAVLLAAGASAAIWGGRLVHGQPAAADVLRTKGVIIEDQAGHPRILIGAPIPPATARQRSDPMDGILILDAAGVDRVAVGAPAIAPFVRGRLYPRISPVSGLVMNDRQGNERGGVGVLDNGRAVVSLDRVGSEAIGMSAEATSGETGLTLTDATSRERLKVQLTTSGANVMVIDANGQSRNLAK